MTRRLRLRGWTGADVEAFLALSTDPEVMRFFPRPATPAEAESFVRLQQVRHGAGEPTLYVVERLEDGAFLGFTGLAVPTGPLPFTPCVEIGWRLVRAAWGHGYATEAAAACLDEAFGERGLAEVVSFTAAVNLPSQAVMRRLGMIRDVDGDFDHPRVPEGSPLRAHVLYRIDAAGWAARG